MPLVPYDPFRDIHIAKRDLGDFYDFGSNMFGEKSPRVDVYQTEKDVVVKAEMPGVSKEDLNLYIDESTVRLSGQTKRENEFKDENTFRSERYYGSFSRTISLPAEVKFDQAKAEYKDGILSITVPKLEPSKTRGRKLNIQ
jgi:HSP20 family protein